MNIPKQTWTVFTLRTLNSLGFSATMPFLAVYLEEARHIPLSIIGVTYLASGLLTLLSELLGGRLTDSIGPKKVMLIGYTSSVVSAAILGVLIQTGASAGVILVIYPIFSLFRAVTQPATSAIIANQEPKYVRVSFSLLNVGGNLGFAIGPAIGGFLSQDFSYSTVFLFSAAVAAIVGGITYARIAPGQLTHAAKEGSAPRRLSWKEDRALIAFLILTMGSFLAVGYEITPLSLYVAGFLSFSNLEIGYLFATNGLIIVALQLPLTKLLERSKYLVLPLIVSAIFTASAFFVASAARTFLEFELVMLLVTLGEIFQSVPSQTVVTLFSRAGNRGMYQGYYFAFTTSGRSLASFLGPSSFSLLSFNPGLAWIIVGGFSLLVGSGYYIISPRLQKDYETMASNEDSKFEQGQKKPY
ncbi:MAG: MFS transporter [Nitrososphaerales archaeon]